MAEPPIELVINQRQFLAASRVLLIDRERYAVARVRRRSTKFAIEFILDRWQIVNRLPSGKERAPMLDWAVMTADHAGDLTPIRLTEAAAPKRSQTLVSVVLDPRRYDRLPVLIADEDRLVAPQRIRFIGSGLLTLPEERADPTESRDSSDPHSSRASRTRGALGETYDRLGQLMVVLVGAGRGGHELARMLVSAGIRRLVVIDGDNLGVENLDAMPGLSACDVGRSKAVLLAESLHRNQPELQITALPQAIHDPRTLGFLSSLRADTVFSFVDSDAARLTVSRYCQESETVHMDVGTLIEHGGASAVMSGDIRLLEPRRGCVACVPRMENLEDVLYELAAPTGTLLRGQPSAWHDHRAGSLLHLNSMISSLAVQQWLSWLNAGAEGTSTWTRIRWPAGEQPTIHSTNVLSADDCKFCHAN